MRNKISLLFVFLIIINNLTFSQSTDEKPPYFVYSNDEFKSYIKDNQVRPETAILYGINANVTVRFHLYPDKTIDSISVVNYDRIYINSDNLREKSLKKVDEQYKEEAIRLIKFSEGLWNPLEKSGILYNSIITIVINFVTEANVKANNNIAKIEYIGMSSHSLKSNFHSSKKDIPYTSSDKYYNLGVQKISEKKYILAEKYLLETIKLNSNDVDAWFNLGQVYYKLQQEKDFCNCMKKASELGDKEAKEVFDKNCN